ncbi:MAG: hypothetical protein AXA67_06665 [Methylothermaceae bacteria B42]|nr:MAG: hypothetical protein AXA67_06665 [Methylothermaceae bacteria B42]HHJ39778.1 Fe-S cluster assembly protein SufD [Methylothermaceae bacterium]
MNLPAEALKPYQEVLEKRLANEPGWLVELRRQALQRFGSKGFPSPREEEWKYTNVSPIERKRFPLAAASGSVDEKWIKQQLLPDCWHLVLVDGFFASALSHPALAGDVIFCDMGAALLRHEALLTKGLNQAVDVDHGFIDFNTALFHGGALVYLTAGTRLEHPIQILHIQTQAAAIPTRHLIMLDEGAEATIIESYLGEGNGLTAHVSEVLLGNHARLQHFKIQEEAQRAFHFGGLYIKQAPSSRFEQTQFALGSLLARSEIHVHLREESQCQLDGLHWANGRRHLDSHTRIIHEKPGAVSRESYKVLAEDHGHSVFQGRIVVEPGAQKTDAAISNKNLLLSENAEVDSKPQLEIYADDVKCAHGVTVGQLDDNALFYLQTRGIDADSARQLLLYGFVNELIEAVKVAPLRQYLHQQLDNRFDAIDLESTS